MARRDQAVADAGLDAGTRQAILEATENLLAVQALSQLSVGAIVGAAGISRATFYLHFASKQAVFRALFRRMLDDVYDVFTHTWTSGPGDPRPRLRAALAASYGLFAQHGAVARAAADMWLHDDTIGVDFRAMITRLIDAARDRIAAESVGGSADVAPEALAAVLIWMNERCFHVHSLGAEPAFAEDGAMLDALTSVWVAVVYGDAINTSRIVNTTRRTRGGRDTGGRARARAPRDR